MAVRVTSRFVGNESGVAGLQYIVFTTTWALVVAAGMYLMGDSLTVRFDAISDVLQAQSHGVRRSYR